MTSPGDDAELLRRFQAIVGGAELGELHGLAAGSAASYRPDLRHGRLAEPVVFHVRAELQGADPPIWRQFALRSDLTLDTVHHVLQIAFDWSDRHLHRFALGGGPLDPAAQVFLSDGEDDAEDCLRTTGVRLDETLQLPGDVLTYLYDSGDEWTIVLRLESVAPTAPNALPALVIDGDRAAPPEDCGGLLTAGELAGHLTDPAWFDVDETNRWLQDVRFRAAISELPDRLVGLLHELADHPEVHDLLTGLLALPRTDDRPVPTEALVAVQWFLDRAKDGLELTSAGYLKPRDVAEAAALMPTMRDWVGRVNRENTTRPVLYLREELHRVGLLRRFKGRLLLTRSGVLAQADPSLLWQTLSRSLIPADGFERDALLLVAAFAAVDPLGTVPLDSVAMLLTQSGWSYGQQPIASWNLVHLLCPVLRNLADAPEHQFQGLGTVRLGPTAARLARAALLPAPRGE